MAEKLTAVKGMNDVLPTESWRLEQIEGLARRVFGRYGFGEVRTPILERTALFVRGVGEETDIVGKEMYTFEDKGGDSKSGTMVSLRPEGTAPAARAAIEHNVFGQEPLVKWLYIGPMFRRERPQKGRFRQFTQFGAEIYGASTPQADAEILDAAYRFLAQLPLGELTLELNSLGDEACRPKYTEALVGYLKSRAADLCPDCQRRLDSNPLRVLDCKNKQCKEVAGQAPQVGDFLCEPCKAHFSELLAMLDALAIPYVVNPRIVRGLDYYTRTVFEFVSRVQGDAGLGSQNTVLAGGRYDKLIKSLGGPEVPAVGFAAGLERLAILLAAQGADDNRRPDLFIAALDAESFKKALVIASDLRTKGLYVDLDLRGGGIKAQMRRADRLKARFAIVLGGNELSQGRGKLKEMATGVERDVELEKISEAMQMI